MKIFSLDSPLFQFMEKVADFFIINFLTLLLLIPVITGGAALTATHKVMQNFSAKSEQPVFKTYFKTFASDFKQSTIVWLISLALVGILAANITLVLFNFSGNLSFFLYLLLGVAAVVLLGAAAFAFPMIARYENTLKQHLRNAVLLAVSNLPKTIIMLALYLIPVALAIFFVEAFFKLVLFWLLIGISITVNLETKLVFPIFQKVESVTDENQKDANRELTEN